MGARSRGVLANHRNWPASPDPPLRPNRGYLHRCSGPGLSCGHAPPRGRIHRPRLPDESRRGRYHPDTRSRPRASGVTRFSPPTDRKGNINMESTVHKNSDLTCRGTAGSRRGDSRRRRGMASNPPTADGVRPSRTAGPRRRQVMPLPPRRRRPGRRRVPGARWLLWAGCLIGLAVGGYLLAPVVETALSTVSTDDAYVNGDVTLVAPRVPGQVARVLVSDNNRVKKGDLLVQLDREPYQVEVDIKKAAVVSAEADAKPPRPRFERSWDRRAA